MRDEKPTTISTLSEGVDKLRQELVELGERSSRDKTVLVSRGRGIFTVERQSVSFLSLSKVQTSR